MLMNELSSRYIFDIVFSEVEIDETYIADLYVLIEPQSWRIEIKALSIFSV